MLFRVNTRREVTSGVRVIKTESEISLFCGWRMKGLRQRDARRLITKRRVFSSYMDG